MDVRIRGAEIDDLNALWEIRNQFSVAHQTMGIPCTSRALLKERWEKSFQDPNNRELVAEVDGKVVGFSGFQLMVGKRRHVMGIGMMVHEEYQGKGIGTLLLQKIVELADRWYQVHRIELQVFSDNTRAIRLYEKFGFEVEGTQRKFAFSDGAYRDVLMMARLRFPPDETCSC
ncbi:MAG TPA: GNAT family N-acetyltransferase [Thermotogota bacterium]|nr:GNAT family N-acetyltransferase [Thermotogota bacterium]HRW91945.1 GNAT family N-acetyltransferase [Thermotogota bacterium]